ncbi:hypothetical protein [Leuconostoc holzapfelii]|uniref:Uncharacterized protein n=1 Tax=Leuconostoc holzapfelii TaxID=434464 RepID=A0A846ZEB0_9LACO|nr:hypothetical protein [Leuconostoc holzapfelii]NKZ17859.1 hypothetical protein [Leuconostoc holzapfelii]
MFNYNNFMDRFKTWRKKPIFWVAMLFLWPLLLLGLLVILGLWSIQDIKKNRGQRSWYQIRGTYGLLFIGILLLSGFTQKNGSNNTEINSQASSTMVSSQSDKSDDQSSSEAKASSKAQQESIAASEKAASEASEKAAYDASVKASSEAAVSSQNAASESAARASAAIAAEEASKAYEAKSVVQQTTEQPTPQNDTGGTVFVTGGGRSDVYWYSTSSMPARTNKNNIITMTEADALAQGKRHSMTE